MRQFHLVGLIFLGAITCLSAADLDLELLKEIRQIHREARKLQTEGKTVKAERIAQNAEQKLRSYVDRKKTYSFPANCPFTFEGGETISVGCEELSGEEFIFVVETGNKRILEELEDCKDGCLGEFTFVPRSRHWYFLFAGKLYSIGADQGICLSIEFRKIKPSPKISETSN